MGDAESLCGDGEWCLSDSNKEFEDTAGEDAKMIQSVCEARLVRGQTYFLKSAMIPLKWFVSHQDGSGELYNF